MSVTWVVLFEEVWKEPMTTVPKRYAVSSNYLARICELLNVPHPNRGYWETDSWADSTEAFTLGGASG